MSTTNQSIFTARKLAICAVCIALAFLLNQISLYRMPMGGSVTPGSMLFIVLSGYWLGPIFGILTGVSMGLLNTITGATVVHPVQYILDYILAFGALGLAGFFRKQRFGLLIGYIVGVFGRFIFVFLSGVFFFYMFAPEGQPVAVYSAIYNMTYILPEAIVSIVLISLPAMLHAINSVTRTIVSPEDFAVMSRNQLSITKAGFSILARMVTGTVIGIFGGMAFVLAGHIQRIQELAIIHVTQGINLLTDAQYAVYREIYRTVYTRVYENIDGIYTATYVGNWVPREPARLFNVVERTLEQVLALHTVGVIFVSVAVVLVLSTLRAEKLER